MTPREHLIDWAAYCLGRAGAAGRFDDEYFRALAMHESVDAATRTPADCIRFYLQHVQLTWAGAPATPRERWHWLRRSARNSQRHDHADPFLERLVADCLWTPADV